MNGILRISSSLPAALLLGVISLTGCSKEETPPPEQPVETVASPKVDHARTLIQQGNPQKAVDTLTTEDSAEAKYLIAVAMSSMKKQSSAKDYITSAIKQAPDNPRYKALALRLRLFEGDLKAIEDLIALHKEHSTNPAVMFFAYFAHEAQRLILITQKDFSKAEESHQQAMKLLETSIVTAAAVPELQREMLNQALLHKMPDPALAIAKRLREAAPNDPNLTVELIKAQLMGGDEAKALQEAKTLFDKTGGHERSAVVYAQSLAKTPPSTATDNEFKALASKYPQNPTIITYYAAYLAKSQRMAESSALLQKHISQITNPLLKQPLLRAAVAIPLDEQNAEIAEKHLNLYREEIGDEALCLYFEGRLLYLRKDESAALVKFNDVLKLTQKDLDRFRPLANESLLWMRKIMLERMARLELMKTQEQLQGQKPAPEQPASESPNQEPKPQPENPSPQPEEDAPTTAPQPEN